MFCKNCGHKLDDDARFCPNCGTDMGAETPNTAANTNSTTSGNQTYQQHYQPNYQKPVKTTNTVAIVGFILSFFLSIPGLICSILGYKNADQYEIPYKGFATAGIIISAVALGFYVLMLIPLSCTVWSVMPY